ncbi:unnamed protein product, partial [Didymodactylos carnosus]
RYPQSNENDDQHVILRKQDHGYLFPHNDADDDNDLHNNMLSPIVNVITRSKTKDVLFPTLSTSHSTNPTSCPPITTHFALPQRERYQTRSTTGQTMHDASTSITTLPASPSL